MSYWQILVAIHIFCIVGVSRFQKKSQQIFFERKE